MNTKTSTYKKHFFLNTNTNADSNIYNKFKLNLENAFSYKENTSFASSSRNIFNLTKNIVWVCKHCGHIHIGVNPPDACPICNLSQSTYEIRT